jgi:hypothetical protein
MLKRSCRTFVIALSASAFLAPCAPALAGQTHVMGTVRPTDVGWSRAEPGTASHPGMLVAPLQVRPLGAAADALPIHTLPSFVPVRAYSAFWPQLRVASMFAAGSNWYQCAAKRSAFFVPAFPPATVSPPFDSPACGQDWSAVGDADGFTTLTPGQNKDALYGPAYTPRDFGTP